MKRLVVALCILTCLSSGRAAAKPPVCAIEPVSFVFETHDEAHRWTGLHDFEMILDRNTCGVGHIWTPDVACELRVGTSHGSLDFDCGRAVQGSWLRLAADDDRSYFESGAADRLLDDTREDMASFLSDLRLDPVDDPVGRLHDLEPSFNREKMLKPIMACVPH